MAKDFRTLKFLKKIKALKSVPVKLAKHSFLTGTFLFALAMVFGGVLFYNNVILVQDIEQDIFPKISFLKEDLYLNIEQKWREQEDRFKAAGSKRYPDPFWDYSKGPATGD